ncbi:MAG: hypothetical protein A3F68_04220 [Acidobacteria bacterium RIFCSPLOWO2_12_FULL_54_10]|nr:MAG: hypothetical protein A3F68_04220 [Acidobacteria bacterium RIFCSPLOWO2_12_FULL_54_10]
MDAATKLYNNPNTVQDVLALKGKKEDLFLEVNRATVPMSEDDLMQGAYYETADGPLQSKTEG